MSQLWALSMALKNREEYEVMNQTLPGKFSVEEGISYWKVEPKNSKEMLSKLFQGKKSSVFGNNTSSAIQKKPVPQDIKPDSYLPKADEAKNEGTEKANKKENQGITFEVVNP